MLLFCLQLLFIGFRILLPVATMPQLNQVSVCLLKVSITCDFSEHNSAYIYPTLLSVRFGYASHVQHSV